MRKKIKYDGNIAIILAISLSAILLISGVVYKKSKGLEEYIPMAAEKEEKNKNEEKAEENNLKTEEIALLCWDKNGLESLDFIQLDYKENKVISTNYPKELLVKENGELIKLERLYAKNKKIDKKIIKDNFDKKDFIYLQVDLDKARTVSKFNEKNSIDEIFINAQNLQADKYKRLQEAFTLIDGKFESKKETDAFLKGLSESNSKVTINDNKVKTIRLEEIIDKKAMSILQGNEKDIKIAYRKEEELKAYKGYIDIKEKEEKKLKELTVANTTETTNKRPTVTKPNNNTGNTTKPNTGNTTKPKDEENLNNNNSNSENDLEKPPTNNENGDGSGNNQGPITDGNNSNGTGTENRVN